MNLTERQIEILQTIHKERQVVTSNTNDDILRLIKLKLINDFPVRTTGFITVELTAEGKRLIQKTP